MMKRGIRLLLILLFILGTPATDAAAAPLLKPGARGAAVENLQKNLSAIGYAVPATGFFGSQTKQAVMSLQRSAGLKADGIVGTGTWTAIEKRIVAKNALAHGIYIVQRADTISSVAGLLRIKPEDLAYANSMSVTHPLYIGQALTVPSAADSARIRSQASIQVDVPPVTKISSLDQEVSLTFDDDPGAACFEQILDTLAQHAVQATFFVTADTAERQPSLIARAVSLGHQIENHGVPIGQSRDTQDLVAGIQRCSALIQQMTGKNTRFYRPLDYSGGVDVWGLSSLAGHQVVMWTNLGSPEAEQLLSATKSALADGAIIRLSLNDPVVPQILGSLLNHIRGQGYTLAPLDRS